MNILRQLFLSIIALFCLALTANAAGEKPNISEIVFEHVKDSHEWHITGEGENAIVIDLPVIVHSSTGWHVFMSNEFEHHASEDGFRHGPDNLVLGTEGSEAGKIYEKNGDELTKTFDISITKTVVTLFLCVVILLCMILIPARKFRKMNPEDKAEGGFSGLIAFLYEYVVNDIAKANIGPGYEKYCPYLLSVFFFILTCNVIGMIPLGFNVTGNIACTFLLAVCTFIIVQFSGNKHYWKDIFWPEVPLFLKTPVFPMMQVIEFVGIFTKPFALMIRLFANMLAGHAIAIAVPCIIFVVASAEPGMKFGLSCLAVVMSIFMMCLECLVCFLQAMVFTMLSAVFIGLARKEPEHE